MSSGVQFDLKVYEVLKIVPQGKVVTYADIARYLKNPHAARAVGNALNKNPNAPMVPCHRVVRSDGSIGGYAFGPKKKITILKKEGVEVIKNKVDLKKFGYRFKK